MDCFAEPVIGRRFASTRWLAMTAAARYFENGTYCWYSFGTWLR
jgi:hypothetical protein